MRRVLILLLTLLFTGNLPQLGLRWVVIPTLEVEQRMGVISSEDDDKD